MYEETQHFLSFRPAYHQTETSDNFESVTWNDIVLQTSQQYPFLQHAITAIGSLSKSSVPPTYNGTSSLPTKNLSPQCPRLQKDFAMRHYARFLHRSQRAPVHDTEGQRLALMVCLLVICVEALQCHYDQVHAHIHSGIQILDFLIANQNTRGSPHKFIEDQITQQFRMLEAEYSVASNSDSAFIDETSSFESVDSTPPYTTAQDTMFESDYVISQSKHIIPPVYRYPSDFQNEVENIDPALLKSASTSSFDITPLNSYAARPPHYISNQLDEIEDTR